MAAATVHSPSPHPNQPRSGGANFQDIRASARGQPLAADHQMRDQGGILNFAASPPPTASSRSQLTFAPSQAPHAQDLTPPRNKQPMYQNVPNSKSAASDYSNQKASAVTVVSPFSVQSDFSQQANQPSVENLRRQFQAEPPPSSHRPTVFNGHSAERKDYFDGTTVSNGAVKTSVSGSGSGLGMPAVGSQQQPPVFQSQPAFSASPRLQRPLKPSDMREFCLKHKKRA